MRATPLLASAVMPAVLALGIQNPPAFRSRVDQVRVDVLVTDRGQPVLGLTPSDFVVLDDGVAQTVDIVAFEETPLNVVLALDTSGSISGARLDQLKKAGGAIVDTLRPIDKAALLTFSQAVMIQTPLTNDASLIRAGFAAPLTSGDTALVDAAYSAVVTAESDSGRALVIVFSDGEDTASFLRPSSVLDTARRANVVVYGVATGGPGGSTFLRELCDLTGGSVFDVSAGGKLEGTFLTIFNEFRNRYLIGYTPRNVGKGGWHRIEVRLKNHRASIKARPGYLANR
jgi:Ca-activated chloride channel family protein